MIGAAHQGRDSLSQSSDRAKAYVKDGDKENDYGGRDTNNTVLGVGADHGQGGEHKANK